MANMEEEENMLNRVHVVSYTRRFDYCCFAYVVGKTTTTLLLA